MSDANGRGMAVGRALVVGGGIAGLSAAIALSRRGVATTVLERHGRAEGASIAITNRAVHALEELGVLDACLAAGVALRGTSLFARIHDGAGNLVPVPPPPPPQDTGLPSSISLYRPTLARILAEAATSAGAAIHLGRSIRSLRDQGDRVETEWDDGSRHEVDIVVGADGTHSAVRPLIHGDALRPDYTGTMGLRWMLQDGPEGQPGFYVLPDNSMVATTRLPGNLVYFASGVEMPNRRVDQAEARSLVRGILDRYSAPFLIALRERLTDDQEIIARPFEWLMAPAPWHRGRITLIGDAAHSTTAHLSSGGGMALEDSVVLAEELAGGGGVAAALDRFMARRIGRTRLVVEASVELLRLQQRRAHPAESAALRARAVGALMQPY
jgi:2-polyprenyl-6-methoxyphenol hydroxylase-like FAD-dependent oxidoreductase